MRSGNCQESGRVILSSYYEEAIHIIRHPDRGRIYAAFFTAKNEFSSLYNDQDVPSKPQGLTSNPPTSCLRT